MKARDGSQSEVRHHQRVGFVKPYGLVPTMFVLAGVVLLLWQPIAAAPTDGDGVSVVKTAAVASQAVTMTAAGAPATAPPLAARHQPAGSGDELRAVQHTKKDAAPDVPPAPPAISNACPATSAGVLASDGSTPIVGSTIGSTDNFVAGCGSAPGGQDQIFEFTVDASGVWSFDTCGSGWDTTIEIREETGGGCPGNFVACDGDSCTGAPPWESALSTFLTTGTTYYLIVDGWNLGAFGNFTVNISNLGPVCTIEADCDDGVFCNGAETCNLAIGQCQPGTPPCDDGNPCTDDICDPVSDVCSFPLNYDPAVDCCDPVFGNLTPVDDGDACTVDACDPATGQVSHTPIPCQVDANCPAGASCDLALAACVCTAGCVKVVPAGNDCWTTQCGGTRVDFNDNPIPADFFAPGSLPFDGTVFLKGATGGIDTQIARLADMCLDGPLPQTRSIGIEIVQLDLVSCEPITVQFPGGVTQQWTVVTLLTQPQPSPAGSMTVRKTVSNGGTYDTSLNIAFDLQFLGPGQQQVDLTGQTILIESTDLPWAQVAPGIGCGTGFHPGTNPNDPTCCDPSCHSSRGTAPHEHCVIPPDCPPCKQACCFDDGTPCQDLTPADCVRLDGAPRGAGTSCADPNICTLDQPCADCGGNGLPHWIDTCPAGTDYMPTGAVVGIDTTGDCLVDQNLVLTGAAQVGRDAGALQHFMQTEIVSMTLTGGGAVLRAGAGGGIGGLGGLLLPSPGLIIEQDAAGVLADSTFDVRFEIDLGGGVFLYNHTPLTLYGKIDCVPPDAVYTHFVGCLPLFDSPTPGTGTQIANLVSANHDTFPDEPCELLGGAADPCAALATQDCLGSPTEVCLPRIVEILPIPPGGVQPVECDCFGAGPGCGPVTISPDGDTLSCEGQCPNGIDLCQIFVDGNPTGQPFIFTTDLAPGALITCDCPKPPPDPHITVQGTSATFGAPDVPAVPADFFFPGSDPFVGAVNLVGGTTDTLGQRDGPIVCPTAPLPGACNPVSVELVQLDLVSSAPIIVQPGNTTWDVRVELSPTGTPPAGSINATLTHANGGTYNADIPFVPVFIFTEVGNPLNQRTLDYDGLNRLIRVNFLNVDWVIQLGPGLVGTIVAPNDGNFVPGVREVNQGDPNSQVVIQSLGLSKEGGIDHPVQPPQIPPPLPPPDPHITLQGTSATFGSPDVPGIPADFFGPGADPFVGTVNLVGGPTDTLGQRGGSIVCPPPIGLCNVVSVELVQLDLVSSSPVVVTFNGGQNPELWDVKVDLSPTGSPPLGTLTATLTHANGGTYDADIPFSPRFTFTNVTNPLDVRALDYDAEGIAPIIINFLNVDWVVILGPGLVGTIDAPNDGNFVPGVREVVQGDPNSQVLIQSLGLSKGGGIDHPVQPPPTFCPLDPAFGDCSQWQQRDCPGRDDQLCLPLEVVIVPGGAEANECTCFDPGPGCGPVQIGAGGDTVSCPGTCPNPNDLCVLHLSDGTTAGQSASSSDFAVGTLLTCACEPTCTKLAPPGIDCWATACDGSSSYDFALTPIPADFFGPGSDPFTDVVAVGGVSGGGPDTQIQRLDPMCFDGTLPVSAQTPIELVALDLISCDPITVTFPGSIAEEWKVIVQLAGTQPLGTLTAVKKHANGGTYTATVPVNAQFLFERVSDGATAGPIAAVSTTLSTTVPAPWLQSGCTGPCGGVGFCPGTDTDPNTGQQCCKPTCHKGPSPGHEHCTQPPDCLPCPECTYNNGQPLDDFGGPASQYDSLFPFSAEAADDFFFTGKGTNSCVIQGVRFWATHFIGGAGGGPVARDPNTDWTGVTVTIYDNANPKAPSGNRNDDGSFSGIVVATRTVPMASVLAVPFLPAPCTDPLSLRFSWQIDVTLTDPIELEKNHKYWIVFQPNMSFDTFGQTGILLSQENHDHPAQQIFPLADLLNWTEIPGNVGACNNPPPGTLTDIAFEIFAEKQNLQGACCYLSQGYPVCVEMLESDCVNNFGGTFQGSGTTCPTENVTTASHVSGPFTHLTDPVQQCPAGISRAGTCVSGEPIDPWRSPENTIMCHQFDIGPESPPIPADFFAPGSDPFSGQVCLEGEPLGPVTLPGHTNSLDFGDADTLIRRSADPFDRCDLPSAAQVTVDVEIVALSLKSTAPITVTFNGGQNPEQWDVAVDLSPTVTPPLGTITAVKTHCNGGTYSSAINVQPRFTFTKVGSNPPEVRVLDTGLEGIPHLTLNQPDPNNPLDPDPPWSSDVSGNLGLVSLICTDFHPGIEDGNPTIVCTCDINEPQPVDPGTPNDRRKNRYISFKPNNIAGDTVKLEVTLTASIPHPALIGSSWWVQPPVVTVPQVIPIPLVGAGECVALLGPQATAADIDWVTAGCTTLHVTGCPIEPTSDYDVRAVAGASVSAPLGVPTILQPGSGKWWGDLVGIFNGVQWTPPNLVTNIDDVNVAIKTFQGGQVVAPVSNVAHLSVADVDAGDNNLVVNFNDVLKIVLAFKGNTYPFGPADTAGLCPPPLP